MRYASPGARVGNAWEKVRVMNGMPLESAAASSNCGSMDAGKSGGEDGLGGGGSGGRGMEMGTLRFSMADVGMGGWESMADAIPGTRRTTSF